MSAAVSVTGLPERPIAATSPEPLVASAQTGAAGSAAAIAAAPLMKPRRLIEYDPENAYGGNADIGSDPFDCCRPAAGPEGAADCPPVSAAMEVPACCDWLVPGWFVRTRLIGSSRTV